MQIDLWEHQASQPYRLSIDERDALAEFVDITPVAGEENAYTLRPGSTVGAVEIGGLSVSIHPKIDVSRVLYLASYAMGAFRLRHEPFTFAEAPDLVGALVSAFVSAAQKAFARGLLHGYRTQEEALYTVRGRIAFAEQIRRRFDVPLPVEVRYDEFTEDIEANRLVKAAATLLGTLRVEHEASRHGLRHIASTLANVSLVRYPPHDIPEVAFDRLNGHYREVVELSRLVLRHASFEADRGGVRASGFLIDMNVVFQEFVTRSLRETLALSERGFRSDQGVWEPFDEAGKVHLAPDFSWWEGSDCVFVGDAKYKNVEGKSTPVADLYQALAYATAFEVPAALLAYAEGEAAPRIYEVRHAHKRLEVATVRLGGTITELHASIEQLAQRIRGLRAKNPATRTSQAA
ncbi:MAG: hypothetical protein OXI51_02355 [Chloroflexota bacterium]|nr:hypothetical protein [Chloroflexota bacterium]